MISPDSRLKSFLALATTPFIIFISSAIALFLPNQVELEYDLTVLIPFVVLFLSVWFSFAFCFIRNLTPPLIVWLYLLAGPYFLLVQVLQNFIPLPFSFLGNMTLVLGPLCMGAFFLRRKNYQKILSFLFALLCLLGVTEISIFLTTFEFEKYSKKKYEGFSPLYPQEKISFDQKQPNIYHIIFDGYQSSLFSKLLTDEQSETLHGFTFYANTASAYSMTAQSIPSVFYGFVADEGRHSIQYQKTDSTTMLHQILKKYDYTHYGLQTMKIVDEFDESINFLNYRYTKIPYFKRRIIFFVKLWGQMVFIKNKQVLPEEDRVMKSFFGFNDYIDNEQYLSPSNRYTYVHVMLPHAPFVLDAHCQYRQELNFNKISDKHLFPLSQCHCATKLMIKFLDELKRLDRYDTSIIIIHADHGLGYKTSQEMNDLEALSKALLLFKPPQSKSLLATSHYPASLIDIAPTILDAAQIPIPDQYKGVVLSPDLESTKRVRYHYSSRYYKGSKKFKKFYVDPSGRLYNK